MLDHAPPLQRLVHALLEEAHALAAVGLGPRQRDVGVTKQRRRRIAVARRQRDTGARGAYELAVADRERRPQRLHQAVGVGHDVAEIVDADEGNGELIARAPGDEVAAAKRALDAPAHGAKHGVAGGEVRRVVDLLELVDVETEHREMCAVALHVRHGVGQDPAERLAVGKAGQRVVVLEIAHPRLGLSMLLASHPGKRRSAWRRRRRASSMVMAAIRPK